MRRIAINAGQDGSVIVQSVKESEASNFGYNAASGEYGDMIDMGIADPAMVTRAALENAVSIAGMVLTTNCLVTEKPSDMAAPAPAPAY